MRRKGEADTPELCAFLLDLDGQLTSGSENKGNGAITGRKKGLPGKEKKCERETKGDIEEGEAHALM